VTPLSAVPVGVVIPSDLGPTTGSTIKFKIRLKGTVRPGSYPIIFAGKDDNGRERDSTLTLVIQ